jgi:DNA-binding HxlR family transcriptional regulator
MPHIWFVHKTISTTLAVMALGTGYQDQDCSIARALEVVGERWTILILRDCFLGVRRFSDLHAHLDISKAVLTERLNSLVSAGLLQRVGDGHAEYVLTEAGRAFAPVLISLSQWGRAYANPTGRPTRILTHTCGTELDAAGSCRRCGVTPPPEDVISSPEHGHSSRRTDPVTERLRDPHRLLEPLRP